MARTTEDIIEEEVRRRLAERYASAGVEQGRVSLEVLYLLPPEFVREYVRLFHQALSEDLSGGGGGMGKDEGQIKAKAGVRRRHKRVPATEEQMEEGKAGPDGETVAVEGTDRGAQAGQKRYKTHWVIRDEKALKAKSSVDRKLIRIVEGMRRDDGMRFDGGEARDASGRFMGDQGRRKEG